MSMWPHPIKAVLFDNDGLLLDTESIYASVHLELTGKELDWDLRRKLMGLTGPDSCAIVVKEYGLDIDPLEFMRQRNETLKQHFINASLLPGAVEIIRAFKERKIPIALATSSPRENINVKMSKKQDFYKQFDAILCGDEVTKGKPDPEIFLNAMKKLSLPDIKPENVIVFEDAPSGIKGANNAGMASVMVPDPDLPMPLAVDEIGATPTIILKSLNEFEFNLFEWNLQ